jgi:hypothetical protein
MFQSILVGLIFIAAVLYIGRLIFRSFRADSACSSGCGKCAAIDFKKLEAQLKEKGI